MLLQELVDAETNAEKKLTYSLQLIVTANSMDSNAYKYSGYLQKGNAYQMKGDLTKALESYFEASRIADKNDLIDKKGSINISIADAYSIMGDNETSVRYYREALELLEESGDSINLASAQLNLGDEYFNQKKLDSALYLFSESGKIFKAKDFELGEAYNIGNVGLVYAEMGEIEKAEENLNHAVDVLTKLGDYQPICVYLNAISDIFEEKNNTSKALEYALKSLNISKRFGLKDEIGEANLRLSDIYEKRGDFKESFSYYKEHIKYRDSVANVKSVQKMASVRADDEISKKQLEVDLANQQTKTQRIIVFAIALVLLFIIFLAISLFKRNKFMRNANETIAIEKQRSDDLLTNILPEETAEELKQHGVVKAKQFDSVSVLFTDFKGFTEEAGKLSPEKLVESINFYFSKFDEIIEKYELEKIKTIGDAYMCAGGLPFPVENHTAKMCQAALEITEFVKKTKRSINHKLAKFDIRVGINTGSVVAGVVGTTKFQYDIWGDAVNIAARMESASEPGRVNISESTYQILKQFDVFQFTPRGEIEAKGKGKIQMYFVDYVD
ncbi:adenylate/guanylate cyclase domain-containing protein [Psychroserpens mesophilus]|uniref:adenylate/guanylate cyclase domain-containing protein n=1 Tax=Psychroserpens mesophilus TaxID=325473 RepID=UPI003D65A2F9